MLCFFGSRASFPHPLSKMSTLEKCKTLVKEVVSDLESRNATTDVQNPSDQSSLRSLPAASSGNTSSVMEEHRRFFGFNPRGKVSYHPFSQRTQRGLTGKKKQKRTFTWTRNFVCLAAVDATTPPTAAEYFQLKNAGLGEKKITLNVEDGALDVDFKLKEVFSKLELAGGYCLMRTFERARTLTLMNGPYSCERIREAMGQGKIFIRPL